MLQAIQWQSVVYKNKGIDMLKDGITLPGLGVLWLFGESTLSGVRREKAPVCTQRAELCREVCTHLLISLVDEGSRDLYSMVHANLVGDSSIVFHRYHEAGLTRLHSAEYGNGGKLCHSVLGVNTNALYLYCIMRDMLMGDPINTRWVKENWSKQAGRGVREQKGRKHTSC